jgi:hypothetical protein
MKPELERLFREHFLCYGPCLEPDCDNLHYTCICGNWQGSRLLKDEVNIEDFIDHLNQIAEGLNL